MITFPPATAWKSRLIFRNKGVEIKLNRTPSLCKKWGLDPCHPFIGEGCSQRMSIVMTLINRGKGQTPRRLESNILELVVSLVDWRPSWTRMHRWATINYKLNLPNLQDHRRVSDAILHTSYRNCLLSPQL